MDNLEGLITLFKAFASKYQGYTLINKGQCVFLCILDDVILTYEMGGRDRAASFTFLTRLENENDIGIRISHKVAKILKGVNDFFEDGEVLNDIKELSVSVDNEFSKKLVYQLLGDYTFTPYLKKLGKNRIEIVQQTISLRITKAYSSFFGDPMKLEELEEAYLLLKETKKALLYFAKKI